MPPDIEEELDEGTMQVRQAIESSNVQSQSGASESKLFYIHFIINLERTYFIVRLHDN